MTSNRAWLVFYAFGIGYSLVGLFTGGLVWPLLTIAVVALNIRFDIKFKKGIAKPKKAKELV